MCKLDHANVARSEESYSEDVRYEAKKLYYVAAIKYCAKSNNEHATSMSIIQNNYNNNDSNSYGKIQEYYVL